MKDFKINVELKFVESALSGSHHKFEILLTYKRPKVWDFEYISYPIYFYLVTKLFYVTWEPNANQILITKHGKEDYAKVRFNLKAKHINKKENIKIKVKNSFGIVCHTMKFKTEVYTKNCYN